MEGGAEMGDGRGVTLRWEDAAVNSRKRKQSSEGVDEANGEKLTGVLRPPKRVKTSPKATPSNRTRAHPVNSLDRQSFPRSLNNTDREVLSSKVSMTGHEKQIMYQTDESQGTGVSISDFTLG
jgi:hypothetical protein